MLANGLLGLTIIIAMSGIANTVALGVLERTNEIGLLRSVGMSRRQVRSMIRHEVLITSTVGAVLGVGFGVAIAAAGSTLLPSSFIATLVVPTGQVVAYLVIGVLLGMIAALVPALRASRLILGLLDASGLTTRANSRRRRSMNRPALSGRSLRLAGLATLKSPGSGDDKPARKGSP